MAQIAERLVVDDAAQALGGRDQVLAAGQLASAIAGGILLALVTGYLGR